MRVSDITNINAHETRTKHAHANSTLITVHSRSQPTEDTKKVKVELCSSSPKGRIMDASEAPPAETAGFSKEELSSFVKMYYIQLVKGWSTVVSLALPRVQNKTQQRRSRVDWSRERVGIGRCGPLPRAHPRLPSLPLAFAPLLGVVVFHIHCPLEASGGLKRHCGARTSGSGSHSHYSVTHCVCLGQHLT